MIITPWRPPPIPNILNPKMFAVSIDEQNKITMTWHLGRFNLVLLINKLILQRVKKKTLYLSCYVWFWWPLPHSKVFFWVFLACLLFFTGKVIRILIRWFFIHFLDELGHCSHKTFSSRQWLFLPALTFFLPDMTFSPTKEVQTSYPWDPLFIFILVSQ